MTEAHLMHGIERTDLSFNITKIWVKCHRTGLNHRQATTLLMCCQAALRRSLIKTLNHRTNFVVYMWQCLVHSRLGFNCQDAAILNYVAKKVRLAQNWASQSETTTAHLTMVICIFAYMHKLGNTFIACIVPCGFEYWLWRGDQSVFETVEFSWWLLSMAAYVMSVVWMCNSAPCRVHCNSVRYGAVAVPLWNYTPRSNGATATDLCRHCILPFVDPIYYIRRALHSLSHALFASQDCFRGLDLDVDAVMRIVVNWVQCIF